MNTHKKIGNLQNNTSPDLETNKQNAYLRQEINMALDSDTLYKYKQEEAAKKIAENKTPAPANINPVKYVQKDTDDNDDDNG